MNVKLNQNRKYEILFLKHLILYVRAKENSMKKNGVKRVEREK